MTITCGACREPIVDHYGNRPASVLVALHRKFCTPKRKTRAQIAAEKRDQQDEDNAVGSRPLRHQSYTGRMWLQSMEKIQSLLRIEAEHAPEDARAVAAMVNEGGRRRFRESCEDGDHDTSAQAQLERAMDTLAAMLGNVPASDNGTIRQPAPCPVPSSVTGAACELPAGHPADSAKRFHKYPAPQPASGK